MARKQPPPRPAPRPVKSKAEARPRARARTHGERVDAELVPSTTALTKFEGDTLPAIADKGGRYGRQIDDLLVAFFAKRSADTIRNYKLDLMHFARWCGCDTYETTLARFFRLEPLQAVGTMLRYVEDMRTGKLGRTYASQTINHRIAALRQVTQLARVFKLCEFDLDVVRGMKVKGVRSTEGCGPEGYATLLALAERDVTEATAPWQRFVATRDAALLVLLHDVGLRRFEGLTARYPEDVDFTVGRLRFRGKKRHDKEWFDINERALAALRRYVNERGAFKGALFFSKDPEKALNRRSVNRIIADLSERAGVKVTPHGLRHTAATTLLDKTDGDVRGVAAFLRHEGLGTVQQYDDARKRLPKKMGKLLENS